MNMSRKRFLGSLASGTVVLLFQGCGGGGGGYGGTPMPSTTCNATSITNVANHGHALSVPKTDLDSTTDKIYSIKYTATHDHTVTLTVAMLVLLKAGLPVTVTSTTTLAHNHDVTVRCL